MTNDYQGGNKQPVKNPADNTRTKTGSAGGADKNRNMPGQKSGLQNDQIRRDQGGKSGGFGGNK